MYCSLLGLLYSPYPPRLFGRSNVRHQVTPTSTMTREIPVAKGGSVWGELTGNLAWDCDFHVNSGIFYMPQICDMGPTVLLPFRRKACWGFFRPERSWWLRLGLNPWTWVLKGSMLPLAHRSRYCITDWMQMRSPHFKASLIIYLILFIHSLKMASSQMKHATVFA